MQRTSRGNKRETTGDNQGHKRETTGDNGRQRTSRGHKRETTGDNVPVGGTSGRQRETIATGPAARPPNVLLGKCLRTSCATAVVGKRKQRQEINV